MSNASLDLIDQRILRKLSKDGRISNTQLAQQVGLSPSPCWQRVRRLEQQGVITSYRAILDQEKLGAAEIVMIEVILNRHDDDTVETFGKQMLKMPEVLEVHLTTGEYDYQIKVAVDGTRGYEEFLRKKLYRVPGIRHSRSSFVLRTLKDVQAYLPED
ncbi:transcriptional regulator, AsnC family [Roseovarius pacificus]|uniref:Transcriptional regulator, AsnC family n=1 Tax=Roseovarius pacificus TaxID=337701 RepID=A0A1M7KB48_9RHOB|nr:Lrp/AsnC family transcriptional regulator [Roseovarius pacificus]GGO62682.1 AsnC family transcriptional regulator [Roseovarius pacificus]SHM62519.1 transcriptional regulator, AsnC family [Roseovarius pacificus]